MYKMAGVMAQCGGLECMLNRLAGIKDFKQGRHLLTVSWRQQDGSSPPLLEGPLRTARPLPLSPRGQHGAAERCTPGTHLAVALALHTSGSLPQCSLPDHSPPPNTSVIASLCCASPVTCGHQCLIVCPPKIALCQLFLSLFKWIL